MKKEELFALIGEADEQKVAAAGIHSQPAKRPLWLKWSVAAACVCLILIGAYVSSTEPAVELVKPPKEGTEPSQAHHLVVNTVPVSASTDMDVKITLCSDLTESQQAQMRADFQTAFGIDYETFVARIPDTLVLSSFYSVDTPTDGKQYLPHDYVFDYQTAENGTARLALSASEPPLRDSFFLCDAPKESEINGVSMIIYGLRDNSYLIAAFEHLGIYYEIEAKNLSLAELEGLLVSLLTDAAEPQQEP